MKRLSQIRGFQSLSNPAALTLAAAVMLVPANMLPVLDTEASGHNRSDTIFSGIVELWRQGLWSIAIIVFTASMVVPALKLVGLTWLLLSARHHDPAHSRRLTRIYAALDFIGRWSMLDVFLVAFLSGLIQFGEFSTVAPRAGILAFAAVVILTVLATQAFNPRVFWPDPTPTSEILP